MASSLKRLTPPPCPTQILGCTYEHTHTHMFTDDMGCSCWTCEFPCCSVKAWRRMVTHSHLLAPAARANSDWQLPPPGHHRLSIARELSKQTVHQRHAGNFCPAAFVSTTFPHLHWLLDKDCEKKQVKNVFLFVNKARLPGIRATDWEYAHVYACVHRYFCMCVETQQSRHQQYKKI